MDEIEQRLKDACDHCLKAYTAWVQTPKDGAALADLSDAVHELRRIASRLEIEIAVNERNEMTSNPIPIPPHRAMQSRHGHDMNDFMDGEDEQPTDNMHNRTPGQAHSRRSPGRTGGMRGPRKSG